MVDYGLKNEQLYLTRELTYAPGYLLRILRTCDYCVFFETETRVLCAGCLTDLTSNSNC